MPRLNQAIQTFIVQSLACFRTPSEVVTAVKDEFNVSVTRPQVQFYDPTKRASQNGLAKKWEKIFKETRDQYIDDLAAVGVAHQRYRLDIIQDVVNRQLSSKLKNEVLLLDAVERAAKEVGGAYTNKRELTGKDGAPLVPDLAPGVLDALKAGYDKIGKDGSGT
jgi:hypothetical protein